MEFWSSGTLESGDEVVEFTPGLVPFWVCYDFEIVLKRVQELRDADVLSSAIRGPKGPCKEETIGNTRP